MAFQVMRDPEHEGYAIFSTYTDTFVKRGMSGVAVIDFFVEDAVFSVKENISTVLDKLDAGKKPYMQFTLTFKEAMKLHNEHKSNRGN
jgi:hypothetical protein